MRLTTILLTSLLAACATDPSDDPAGGGGDPSGDPMPGGGGGGGSGSGGGSGGGNTSTASGYLASMQAKFCDEAFSCQASFPATEKATFTDEWGTSQQDCYSAPQPDDPQVVDARVQAGALRFDASAASACLSGITFASCDAFWTGEKTLPASCDTVLVGMVADGGACQLGIECSNASSYCDKTTHVCTVNPGK